MANVTAESEILHQAVHGYRHGHQLLSASTVLDDGIESILGHNSDSAPRSRISNGSYLSGYPLPDGAYVVARTWPDESADRPNTVVTRSVLLPRSTSLGADPDSLLDALTRPTESELTGRALPPLTTASRALHASAVREEEAEMAASFYWSRSRLSSESELERQRIAMALWGQLWSRARDSFFFCTSPDTTRFSDHPHALLFESGTAPPSFPAPPGREVVVQDLIHPGRFREFLHFVGSGELNPGLMVLFAEAFLLLEGEGATADQLSELLGRYSGLEPRRLRRMKRRLLSFHGTRPRWRTDPLDVLDALARRELGTAVYASDASLDRWLASCWVVDPLATTVILEGQRPPENPLPSGPPTAAEGLRGAFSSQAATLVTPHTLGLALRVSERSALNTVWQRNEQELWLAWAELDAPLPTPESPPDDSAYEWGLAVSAMRGRPDKLIQLLNAYPESVNALVAVLERHPRDDDAITLPKSASGIIRHRLENDEFELTGLSHLADASKLPDRFQAAAWATLLERSTDAIVHAVAYLLARRPSAHAPVVAARAMGLLYRDLQGVGGQEAWSRLSPQIRGDRGSWDRCGRLVDDYRDAFQRLGDRDRFSALSALEAVSADATRELAKRLKPAKAKHFSLWDPTTWLS